ncbi:VOC family protein [Brevibacillus migulae]|uniref:VOC family protein n=1 Tax=Brevibacillus migulae TaxID=1644114 RepID=UPI00106EFE23|nr:VOC family protein [Brevibacillus migulae]
MEIVQLSLQTASLQAMKHFYETQLDFTLLAEEADRFTVAVGSSRLEFWQAPAGSEPTYHIAFRIPENKCEEALEWLKQRAKVLANEEDGELVHFTHWNAHSIYFHDPAGNIVELIARHNLPNRSDRPFSSSEILGLNEIGLPVDDVWETIERLQLTTGIPVWREPSATFATMGDEHGLLILAAKGRKWFQSQLRAEAYPMHITLRGERSLHVRMKEYLFEFVPKA